jgi:hypothetical protein
MESVEHPERREASRVEATHSQNLQNASLSLRNKSGFKGVHWDKEKRKWLAYIRVDGRLYKLGLFDDVLDAIAARLHAEQELHPFRVHPRLTDIIVPQPDLPVEFIEEWRLDVRRLWQLPPRIHWQP